MPKKTAPEKKLLQLRLEKDVITQLKVRSAMEGKTMTQLITEWVRSWKEVNK